MYYSSPLPRTQGSVTVHVNGVAHAVSTTDTVASLLHLLGVSAAPGITDAPLPEVTLSLAASGEPAAGAAAAAAAAACTTVCVEAEEDEDEDASTAAAAEQYDSSSPSLEAAAAAAAAAVGVLEEGGDEEDDDAAPPRLEDGQEEPECETCRKFDPRVATQRLHSVYAALRREFSRDLTIRAVRCDHVGREHAHVFEVDNRYDPSSLGAMSTVYSRKKPRLPRRTRVHISHQPEAVSKVAPQHP